MNKLFPNLRTFSAAAKKIKLAAWDFDGVFTDNHVYTFEDGYEAVRTSRADGIGLRRLEACGIINVVISGEESPVVKARCDKLSLQCFSGVADKLGILKGLAEYHHITLNECSYLGNDVNDLAILQAVGMPVLVQDALLDDDYGFFHIAAKGGEGAVRYLCDAIISAQQGRKVKGDL